MGDSNRSRKRSCAATRERDKKADLARRAEIPPKRTELAPGPGARPFPSIRVPGGDAGENQAKVAFLQALRRHNGRVSPALDAAGITLATVDRWRRDDEQFRLDEKEVELFRDDFIRGNLDELVADKHPAAVIAAAKSLPEFKTKVVEHKGHISHTHAVERLTAEERAELIEHGRAAIALERAEDGSYE